MHATNIKNTHHSISKRQQITTAVEYFTRCTLHLCMSKAKGLLANFASVAKKKSDGDERERKRAGAG